MCVLYCVRVCVCMWPACVRVCVFSLSCSLCFLFDSLCFLESERNSPHLCFYSNVPKNPSPPCSLLQTLAHISLSLELGLGIDRCLRVIRSSQYPEYSQLTPSADCCWSFARLSASLFKFHYFKASVLHFSIPMFGHFLRLRQSANVSSVSTSHLFEKKKGK